MSKAFLEALGTAVIVLGCFSVAAYLVYTGITAPKMVGYTPAFKAKQCFVRNEIREDWQDEVDGIVVQVGREHYLIMITSEADRKFAGDKIGVQMPIREFDQHHHQKLCPLNWSQHKR